LIRLGHVSVTRHGCGCPVSLVWPPCFSIRCGSSSCCRISFQGGMLDVTCRPVGVICAASCRYVLKSYVIRRERGSCIAPKDSTAQTTRVPGVMYQNIGLHVAHARLTFIDRSFLRLHIKSVHMNFGGDGFTRPHSLTLRSHRSLHQHHTPSLATAGPLTLRGAVHSFLPTSYVCSLHLINEAIRL
jgi:hypothetical protein